MNITSDLLTRALQSFPEKPGDAIAEDVEFQTLFCRAMENNEDYAAFVAYCREKLLEYGLTAQRFIQVTTLFVQLGYRLHSIEMMEGMNTTSMTLDDDGEPN